MKKRKTICWVATYIDDLPVAWPAVIRTLEEAGFGVIEEVWSIPGGTSPQIAKLIRIIAEERVDFVILQYVDSPSHSIAIQAFKEDGAKIVLILDGKWSAEDKRLADGTIRFPLLPLELVKLLNSL